ncbi:MAG TPA: DUF378 domain-containing protein [Planctomycetota bacterium]|nr:DUF378 domain-containing protein [Planctomycetota bacterium]
MRDNLRALDLITLILVVIGALNWLLVGLFGVDAVAEVAGLEFGLRNGFTAFIYILVGLAGIVQAVLLLRRRGATTDSEPSVYRRPPTRMAPR